MSFVDPKDPKNSSPNEPTPAPTPSEKKEPLFVLLEEIRDAIQEKNAQTAHHLDRLVGVMEELTKLLKTYLTPVTGVASKTEEKPVPPTVPKQDDRPVPSPTPIPSLEKIQKAFPTDLADMLTFDDKGDFVIIKPRRFLGSDNFAKIASTVRSLGGEYISAGKDSCFRVQKK